MLIYILIVIVILSNFSFEYFSQEYKLKNSRIGSINNLDKQIYEPKFQQELAKINYNFPFGSRNVPLKNSSLPIESILLTSEPVDPKFQRILSNILFENKADIPNVKFINSPNDHSDDIKKVINVFVDQLNIKTNSDWFLDFIEDSNVQISSNSEFSLYSIISFIYNKSELKARGVKLVILNINPLLDINSSTLKFVSIEPLITTSNSNSLKSLDQFNPFSDFISGQTNSSQIGNPVSQLLNSPRWFEKGNTIEGFTIQEKKKKESNNFDSFNPLIPPSFSFFKINLENIPIKKGKGIESLGFTFLE